MDELFIKNYDNNKHNKGGHYIVAMLHWLALLITTIEYMLLRLEHMLHRSKTGYFNGLFRGKS